MPDERGEGKMPPIPDGGLAESMPEWLRRPPAWRTLNDSDVVQPEPAQLSDLPESDTSVIDPRTFLTADDLPEWLRGLGPTRQPAEPARPRDDEPVEGSKPDRHQEMHHSAGAPARFVPRKPAMPVVPDAPARRATTQRSPVAGARRVEAQSTPWWRGTPIVLLLAIMLLIAIGVIVGMVVA